MTLIQNGGCLLLCLAVEIISAEVQGASLWDSENNGSD